MGVVNQVVGDVNKSVIQKCFVALVNIYIYGIDWEDLGDEA
jgi:hypothetical protein